MELFKNALAWIEQNRDKTFEVVRIYLGIGLMVKGFHFLGDKDFLTMMVSESTTPGIIKFGFVAMFLAHYVPIAHIGGGLLIAIGMLTRLAALIQLPILFGAVFFVYGKDGVFTHNQEFQFTALVLFLLILVFLNGAGRWSVDGHVKRRPEG